MAKSNSVVVRRNRQFAAQFGDVPGGLDADHFRHCDDDVRTDDHMLAGLPACQATVKKRKWTGPADQSK